MRGQRTNAAGAVVLPTAARRVAWMAERSPLDGLLALPATQAADSLALANALAGAAAAIARLDQKLRGHPLRQAFLYRARLDAVQRQATVDGAAIDPWHLAAAIEGLRLRMDPSLRIIDRGLILEAARVALGLHQWLAEPDFEQETEVQRAAAALAAAAPARHPLLAAAHGFWGWIEAGEGRAPMRAALVRFWTEHGVLHEPIPITGAAAFRAEQAWQPALWIPAFLSTLEAEALDGLQMLSTLERAWLAARHAIIGRRRTSHATAAVDLLAAAPVISATSLARILGIALKNAIRLLDQLCDAGIAVEVTHRSKRRLFGLATLAPLRDVVRPPYRPDPTRGRGRPPLRQRAAGAESAAPAMPPISPIERLDFDYQPLDEAMAHLDDVLRKARQSLNAIAGRPAADDKPWPPAPTEDG